MRVPLSWLTDFAPFEGDPVDLAAVLDDLGLVVEEIRRVGEGLGDVVLARVLEIGAIPGADRIRRVVVEAGGEPVEVVCGAWNFHQGDIVPFAPVGLAFWMASASARAFSTSLSSSNDTLPMPAWMIPAFSARNST